MVRLKFRYLICQAVVDGGNPADVSQRELLNAIREKIQVLSGDVGSGLFGNSSAIKLFDDKLKIFVIRVPRDSEMEIRLAMSCVSSLKKSSVILRLLSVASCARTTTDRLNVIFSQYLGQCEAKSEKETLSGHFTQLLQTSSL
jgi:RNase P/RNase MRP subunit POP5